ncbi:MAG TPA: glycoside hydrolase family 3 N-terminal domain-containing protein [Ktedonobacterales bacterium]|nr:glycoside hydrolase family 3 N-terminal domain-containing protein [Ktedonobacterales bacterium]
MPAHPARRRATVWLLLLSLVLLAGCNTLSGRQTTANHNGIEAAPPHPSASHTPSAAQDPRRELLIRYTVDKLMQGMTLDEKLGQMFLIETTYKSYTWDVNNMVVGMHAGAMIVYAQNITDWQQLHDYLASIQAHATIPMIVSMDEEGGDVDRLGFLKLDPPLPSAQALAATGNPKTAYNAGVTAAKEMTALGINTNLAPVVDVRTTPAAIEWTRLFGNDPATVDRYAGAFLHGLQDNGVIGCLKHWPGIGSITQDPHQTLPTIDRTMGQLQSTEFAAFEGLLNDDPGMIMVTHVIVPEIDPTLPATLSPRVVQGTLRDKLGYQGVVMTDSLYMKGISLRYPLPQAGVMAVEAGDDLLEGAFDTYSMRGMIAALHNAIDTGRISQARIDQSVRRILTLKVRFGLIPLNDPHVIQGTMLTVNGTPLADADLPHRASLTHREYSP